MLSIHLVVGTDSLVIEGDTTIPEVMPIIDGWFELVALHLSETPAEADHLVVTVGTPTEQP